MRLNLLFLFLILCSTFSLASADNQRPVTDEAVTFSLTPAGFDVISGEIKKNHLTDIFRMPLPNTYTNSNGIDVEVSQTYLSLRFDSLLVRSRDSGLRITVGIRDVHINLERMRFSKKVGPTTLVTKCYDTTIYIAQSSPVYLTSDVNTPVVDNQLKLSPAGVYFSIPDDNYQVAGPGSCDGPLGVNEIIKLVVNRVLLNQKQGIENNVKSKVADTIPTMEGMINGALHHEFTLDMSNMPAMNPGVLKIKIAPNRVTSNDQLFRMIFSISANNERLLALNEEESDVVLPAGDVLGSVGLNPSFITDLLTQLFPNGSQYVELTPDVWPELGEILTVQHLKSLLPDLEKAPLDQPQLRAFVKVAKMPVFSIAENEGKYAILCELNNMDIKLSVNIAGEWTDYFHINANLKTALSSVTKDKKIYFSLLPEFSSLIVKGRWDEGYVPQISWFDEEALQTAFTAIFEPVYSEKYFLVLDLPVIDLAGHAVAISDLKIRPPFMEIDFSNGDTPLAP